MIDFNIETDNNNFCEECNKEFSSLQGLKSHKTRMHDTAKDFN